MPLWNPSDVVGRNEHIGRRLFERRGLVGARDQSRPAKTFELYHFEETRDRQVSLDRLGASSVDRKVSGYLKRRAQEAASRFAEPKSFIGWAVVRAQQLEKPPQGPSLPVIASPIEAQDGDPLTENKFHAHIEMPERYGPYETAMHLKTIFELKYRFEQVGAPRQAAVVRLWNWLGTSLRKIVRS